MTTDTERVAAVLAATGPVLLDFDGPVCGVYAGELNVRAADQLRSRLRESRLDMPSHLVDERDPLAVLRYVGTLGDAALTDAIERELTSIELEAVRVAPKTAGSDDFIHACAEKGRAVVVVSNNAADAIRAYLFANDLTNFVHGVVGRAHGKPEQMKPDPWPVQAALELIDAPPRRCVLVGDSATDIQAAHQAGVRSVAYVKTPDRRIPLDDEHPDSLVDGMDRLADAVRKGPSMWRH
ncbi:MAG: HAD-IA family hydrolase [Propionibacteriales bacterium]|nr:HAD-IA family hydrolase [Propionibacteriales bacterium]